MAINVDLYDLLTGNAPIPPVDNMQDTPPPAAAPAPASAAPPEDDITIKGFAPSKVPLLTRIGDLLTGNRFHMEDHIRQHDIQRALEGYSQDPRAAILRVMKIPGMASKALSMLNTVDDNTESEARGQILKDKLHDQRMGNIRRIMATANEQNYGKLLPYAQKIWQGYGYDDDLPLPSSYDKDVLGGFVRGDMTVDQQEDNYARDKYNGQRIELSRFRAQNTANYQRARLGMAQQGLGIQEERLTEDKRHHRAMEGKLPNPTKANPDPAPEGTVQYTPDGRFAKKKIGGQWWYFGRGSDGKHYLLKGQNTFDELEPDDDEDN